MNYIVTVSGYSVITWDNKTVHIGIKFTTNEGDNGGVVLTGTYPSKVTCGFVVVIYLGGSNLNGLYNDGLLNRYSIH